MLSLQSYSKVFFIVAFLTFFIKDLLLAQNPHVAPKKVKATYYASKFNGKRTYSGEKYDTHKYTAAHKSLPMHSMIKVTNPKNQKTVVVRINDRFRKKDYIDLSWIAAKELGIIKHGTAYLYIEPADTVLNERLKLFFSYDNDSISN